MEPMLQILAVCSFVAFIGGGLCGYMVGRMHQYWAERDYIINQITQGELK